MKTALFNISIGPEREHWKKCLKSQNLYCKKYGIDHYISYKPAINFRWARNWLENTFFEKYQCLYLFERGYDQVLYLDCDVLITPTATNIFKDYSDLDTFYAFEESHEVGIIGETLYGQKADIMDRDPYVNRVLSNNIDIVWKKNKHSKYEYYNAGVQLYGKNSIDHIKDREKFYSLRNLNNIYDFGDQTYVNTLLQKYNIKTQSIDYSYNRMSFQDRDLNNKRYEANFIHYSGPCLYNIEEPLNFTEQDKINTILRDYSMLYEN